jgi:hypothetical protein
MKEQYEDELKQKEKAKANRDAKIKILSDFLDAVER